MAAFILPLHTNLHRARQSFPSRARRAPRRPAPVCERLPPHAPAPASLHPLTGEWAGYEARFTASGEVIPIPDYYIPEEFREWGIVPSGFECHTSVHAPGAVIRRKHIRVLPAVSHFGDHIDVEEDSLSVDVGARGVAVFPDGCWAHGADVAGVKEGKLGKWPRVHMFLRDGGRACGVALRFDRVSGCVVDDVVVVMHDWVGEYADSGVMEGGSGYVSGWVDRGGAVDVEGVWKAENGDTVVESGGVALPAGVDVGARRGEDGCLVWAGWTAEEKRLVLRRLYDDDGKLVYSERLALRRD